MLTQQLECFGQVACRRMWTKQRTKLLYFGQKMPLSSAAADDVGIGRCEEVSSLSIAASPRPAACFGVSAYESRGPRSGENLSNPSHNPLPKATARGASFARGSLSFTSHPAIKEAISSLNKGIATGHSICTQQRSGEHRYLA